MGGFPWKNLDITEEYEPLT